MDPRPLDSAVNVLSKPFLSGVLREREQNPESERAAVVCREYIVVFPRTNLHQQEHD